MGKGKIGAIAVAVVLVVGVGCTVACAKKIPNGYVGTIYSMSGGIQDKTLSQGFHLVSPMNHIEKFSIGNEQLILSADEREGSETNESFLVSTSDNANIKISFQMSYRYIPENVVSTYKKFKGMGGEDIVNQRVKTVLKSKISEATSKYTMMDIYSGNRGVINTDITKFLNEELSKNFGIEVIDASIIDCHPDEQLQKAINDRVTAMQKKQKAEADQQAVIVTSQTKLIETQANADRMAIQTNADADRYKQLSAAITPELIQKWEMEARKEHGWVEIQGASAIIKEK